MKEIKVKTIEKIDKLSRFFKTDMMYVVKSGFWMNLNFIIVSILGLISSVLLARFVSKEVYGTYQFILAIASSIAVFVPNNMSSAVIRAVAQGNDGDFIKATKFQVRWGIIATIISICVSIWYVMNQNYGLSISLLLIAIFMPSTFALNTWGAYVQGKKDYKRYFFYSTFASILTYGTLIITIFLGPNYIALAFVNIFFSFLANLILYFLTIKKMNPGTQTSPDTISFGSHLSIMGIPQGLVGQLDAILIFHFFGAAPLAIYSFATLLPEKLIGGLKFISSIAFPKFAEKSEDEVKDFFKKKIWWLLLFLGILALLYAIFAPYIFDWLFPNYHSSITYSRVFALSFFSVAAGVVHTALLSQKKTKILYASTLITPLVKALLMVSMMFIYGIWGIIWAQIIVIIFHISFPIYLFLRKQKTT